MVSYRLYFIGRAGFARAVDLDCDTDAEAVAAVREHADGSAMELWCGARMVRAFEAGDDGVGE